MPPLPQPEEVAGFLQGQRHRRYRVQSPWISRQAMGNSGRACHPWGAQDHRASRKTWKISGPSSDPLAGWCIADCSLAAIENSATIFRQFFNLLWQWFAIGYWKLESILSLHNWIGSVTEQPNCQKDQSFGQVTISSAGIGFVCKQWPKTICTRVASIKYKTYQSLTQKLRPTQFFVRLTVDCQGRGSTLSHNELKRFDWSCKSRWQFFV